MAAFRILFLVIAVVDVSLAQSPKLRYDNHIVIPDDVDQFKNIGGLSGLVYNPDSKRLIACADKFPARLLEFKFPREGQLQPLATTLLIPKVISSSELEGLVYDPHGGGYYLSDEQSDGTRILKVDSTGRFKEIILPKNAPFLPLSTHNSGIEGLDLSKDGRQLYFAFERPTKPCFETAITTIGKIDLATHEISLYPYELHVVTDDHLNTNGISEIIWLAKDRLLVMERAYLPGTGNVVRLYETKLHNPVVANEIPLDCPKPGYKPLNSNLIFDFANVPEIKIDNAEGMTFNDDRSELYIVTDNNFSSKQETQLIRLKVTW